MADLQTIDQLERDLLPDHIQRIRCRLIGTRGSFQDYQDMLFQELKDFEEAIALDRALRMQKKLIEIELSVQDIAYCLDILRGLTSRHISQIVPKGEADDAYFKQKSIERLRVQLSLKLDEISLAENSSGDV